MGAAFSISNENDKKIVEDILIETNELICGLEKKLKESEYEYHKKLILKVFLKKCKVVKMDSFGYDTEDSDKELMEYRETLDEINAKKQDLLNLQTDLQFSLEVYMSLGLKFK